MRSEVPQPEIGTGSSRNRLALMCGLAASVPIVAFILGWVYLNERLLGLAPANAILDGLVTFDRAVGLTNYVFCVAYTLTAIIVVGACYKVLRARTSAS